ncbi:MAG TPA: RloB family protein [Puia sp.]|jgi:hypothetical protein
MPEAWELKTHDNRSQNTVTTFIIFCEDENSESSYFRAFNIEGKLRVNPIENQRQGKLNLLNTIEKCEKDGLMQFRDGKYHTISEITEHIWCVYDRDLEYEDLEVIKKKDDIDFTSAISLATDSGLHVAWSNDAFELWILLHFEDVPTGQRLHRNYIYIRLTDILKTAIARTPELDIITTHPHFNYRNRFKKQGEFYKHVYPLLEGKREIAIERAKTLEAIYDTKTPFHDRNPCTTVHHLVAELIKYQ